MKLSGLFILLLLVVLVGCTGTNNVYEKMAYFSKHEWRSDVKPSFNFEVTDSTSLYRLFLVLRHNDAYHFKNIWMNIAMKTPDTTIVFKNEFTLADNEKWHGTIVDDIVEQRIPIEPGNKALRLKKGSYTFTLQQVMREDPLQNVMNAGIRVEKLQ
jgi:gliding motility-associated lipoprotein GldH